MLWCLRTIAGESTIAQGSARRGSGRRRRAPLPVLVVVEPRAEVRQVPLPVRLLAQLGEQRGHLGVELGAELLHRRVVPAVGDGVRDLRRELGLGLGFGFGFRV